MISEADARWQIDSTLKNEKFVHCTDSKKAGIYRGKLTVGHTHIDVEVEVPDLNFVKLPRVEIVDDKNLPLEFIAHLDADTGICYADRSLIRLDPNEPGKSILLVLQEAQKALNRSLAGRAQAEVAREYPQYWRGNRTLVMMPLGTTGKLATNKIQYLLYPTDFKLPARYKHIREAYILKIEGKLEPTQKLIAPKTLEEFEEWYSKQSINSKPAFQALLIRFAKGEVVFFIASNGTVGCSVELTGNLKVLANKSSSQYTTATIAGALNHGKTTTNLLRFYGMNSDLKSVTARNTQAQASPLTGKKITLIGCGTIGSHLARFLVQSGAGSGQPFTLIDNEMLVSGNLGRHLLNFDDLGKSKSDALAKELSRFHPEVIIKSINKNILECADRIFDSDLIIDATGIENASEFLSRKALGERQTGRTGNLLHIWLYGNGIAAQSFLNVGQGFACYSCLQPDPNQLRIGDPRKDVKKEPDIQHGSCGDGIFIPFLVSAPVVAAALALDATIDFFSGTPGSRFRSRVLNEAEAKYLNDRSPEQNNQCRVCSGKN